MPFSSIFLIEPLNLSPFLFVTISKTPTSSIISNVIFDAFVCSPLNSLPSAYVLICGIVLSIVISFISDLFPALSIACTHIFVDFVSVSIIPFSYFFLRSFSTVQYNMLSIPILSSASNDKAPFAYCLFVSTPFTFIFTLGLVLSHLNLVISVLFFNKSKKLF